MKNIKSKYSEMLLQLVEQFDEQLPESLTFEDTLEVGIEAWNLANNKKNFGDEVYKKDLKTSNYRNVIDKMVAFKLEHFAEYNNFIVDFSTENNILQVKSETQEDLFNRLLLTKPNLKPQKNDNASS